MMIGRKWNYVIISHYFKLVDVVYFNILIINKKKPIQKPVENRIEYKNQKKLFFFLKC